MCLGLWLWVGAYGCHTLMILVSTSDCMIVAALRATEAINRRENHNILIFITLWAVYTLGTADDVVVHPVRLGTNL